MEGSGSGRRVDRADPGNNFERAGLPAKAAASWRKAELKITGNYKRDAAAGTKFWGFGADLLAKLPKKLQRTPEQVRAAEFILSKCRAARERFLERHAEAVYRKVTKNLSVFVRVEDLVYAAAKVVPGLTPTRREVSAEAEYPQREKDGVEVDQGIFLAHALALPDAGMHLCEAMLYPTPKSLERMG